MTNGPFLASINQENVNLATANGKLWLVVIYTVPVVRSHGLVSFTFVVFLELPLI
jgi:hypothetical protein